MKQNETKAKTKWFVETMTKAHRSDMPIVSGILPLFKSLDYANEFALVCDTLIKLYAASRESMRDLTDYDLNKVCYVFTIRNNKLDWEIVPALNPTTVPLAFSSLQILLECRKLVGANNIKRVLKFKLKGLTK